MKKKVLMIAFIFLISLSFAYAVDSIIAYDELRLDLIMTDPSPLEPGRVFDVHFDVTNLQSYTLRNLEISVVDIFPFYKIDANSSSIVINELRPGEKKSISYRLGINKDINGGVYQLNLQYYSTKLGAVV